MSRGVTWCLLVPCGVKGCPEVSNVKKCNLVLTGVKWCHMVLVDLVSTGVNGCQEVSSGVKWC